MICVTGPFARIALPFARIPVLYHGAGFAREIFVIYAVTPFIVIHAMKLSVRIARLSFFVTEMVVIKRVALNAQLTVSLIVV